MNSQKEIRNIKIKNQLELWLFCAIIGAVAGGLVWALLKIMAVGMNLIWEWVPEHFSLPYYTIGVCVHFLSVSSGRYSEIIRKKWKLLWQK